MNVLVTGGGGFLGRAIVKQLRERGDQVATLSRGHYQELLDMGVEEFRGDLLDRELLLRATSGRDAVIHTAAKAGFWGPAKEYWRVNVQGTQALLDACRQSAVRRFILTSSPSVVFDGRDLEGANESLQYPRTYSAPYPASKAEAERMVLEANDSGFATTSLRPHLIWGPGDPHFLPRLVARSRAGKLRQIGHKPKLVDCIYVDNAAEAHLLALDRLSPGAQIAGRAYFLSQGEPIPIFELINRILMSADAPLVSRSIPTWFAKLCGTLLEPFYLGLGITNEPPMTRFLAWELSSSHWFSIDAARRDLDFKPRISIDEGFRRLRLWAMGEGRELLTTTENQRAYSTSSNAILDS